jgi:Nuclease-related domain
MSSRFTRAPSPNERSPTRCRSERRPGPVITLHNRQMPGRRGDIDHIAIAPTGVYVIDTKDWNGEVQIQTPWFGAPKLLIRGRDCTKLIDGLDRQITAVRSALDRDGYEKVPIWGALCFTKADLPFLRTQKLRGHLLLYRKALAKRLNADGPLQPPVVEQLASHLAAVLPPAR